MSNTNSNAGASPCFHAGNILLEELLYSGHDTAWLAAQTGMTAAELERLFAMSNMDAMLFVRVGYTIGNHFISRINSMILH